jgi:hypothetical protein
MKKKNLFTIAAFMTLIACAVVISCSKLESGADLATCGTCNWYGTNYPVCCNTTSGWGWENNASCISASTCTGSGQTCSGCSGSGGGGGCAATAITPYIQVNGGTWTQSASATVASGGTVIFGPQPTSGGSWSWSGLGTSGTSREQTIHPTASGTATATYTNSCGTKSTQNFTITVSGSGGGGGGGGSHAWTSCDQWGSWSNGGYTVWCNEWGSTTSQCLWANSGTNWGFSTSQPNGGGVKTYPNSSKNVGIAINSYNGTSSWNFSSPSGSSVYYNASFDPWVPTEVMVWVYETSGIGPRGSLVSSNQSIAGHTWNVYRENSTYNVISFVRTSNSTSGSFNMGTMLRWAVSQGWLSNTTVTVNSFGFEVFGTNNQSMNWTVNSMAAN